MDRDIWNSLAHFQTHDLVQRAFQRKHSRELNAQRTREITSCFMQAEEYFRNAHTAAEVVRPLLLYYGVLSIGRGLILFLDKNAKEENLKPSHGLKTKDWKGILGKDLPNILELIVEIEDGIFSELVAVTDPLQQNILPMPDGGVVIESVDYQKSLQVGDLVKFDDILSRISCLDLTYHDVMDRRAQLRSGIIIHTEAAYIVHFINDAVIGVTTADEVRNLFHVPQHIEIGLMAPGSGCDYPNFAYRVEHSNKKYPVACPIIESINEFSIGNIIVPWPQNLYISQFSKCYLTSYVLGMLVRYFPSRWMALIRNQKGDAALPLVRAAIRHIEEDFPRMALALLH